MKREKPPLPVIEPVDVVDPHAEQRIVNGALATRNVWGGTHMAPAPTPSADLDPSFGRELLLAVGRGDRDAYQHARELNAYAAKGKA